MDQKPILTFWVKANALFEKSCQDFDLTWQKRKRILNTKLLVILIFKMVLSKNKQGYGSNLLHLWEACAEKAIALPQANVVSASSLCEARQKLPETIFQTLNQELITLWHTHRVTPIWHNHRVFAIDGSKINTPRGLLQEGYQIANDATQHYPSGLVSCLYNLQEQLIYDVALVSHGNERECALEHFKQLSSGDLVILDRGYFSYLLLYRVMELGLQAIFRLQGGGTNGKVVAFWRSKKTSEIIEYSPSEAVKSKLKKRGCSLNFKPLKLRLVKHRIGKQTYVYATTLLDESIYPLACFAPLYHARWGIEELYKISKNWIEVEDFHSQTERGIKQELYGHVLLINIARIFELDAKNIPPCGGQTDDESLPMVEASSALLQPSASFKINFKNCLAVVGRHLENLILAPKRTIKTWLYKTMHTVSKVKQRIRIGRSYPRISFKPRNRWSSFGASSRA